MKPVSNLRGETGINSCVRKIRTIAILAFVSFAWHAAMAGTWYNNSWLYRVAITNNHVKVSGTLTNFPVLINCTNSSLQSNAQTGGNDVLFTASDGVTKLSHEIESYNSGTGALIAWVNVPLLSSATNTVLYMYYGNASVTNQQNATNVWDANFFGVWHLKESSGNFSDSSEYSHAGTDNVVATGKSGEIGSGQQFNGTNDYINCGTNDPSAGNLTLSFWAKWAGNKGGDQIIIAKRDAGTSSSTMRWQYLRSASLGGLRFMSYSSQADVGADIPDSTNWHFYVVTVSNLTCYFFMDGGTLGYPSALTSYGTATTAKVLVGGVADTAASWNGNLDEVRISNTARSAAWITTEYTNQVSPSTFSTFGSTENSPGPTQLAITSVNGGANPTAGAAFSVVVQSQTGGGAAGNVSANTAVTLSLQTGSGTLGGTLTGTITAGTSSVTISGVTYNQAESGVSITATRTSGDSLTAGTSSTFTVNNASGNWNVNASGNWSSAANWSGNPIVPGVTAGDVVGLTYNITAARTVTIDTTSRTVGTLNIGDSGASYFPFSLAASGGAGLTFNNNGTGASVVQTTTTATDVISAPITLADSLSVSNSSSLIFSGGISGSQSIAMNGGGTLILSGTDTYTGGTALNSGTLQISSGNNVLPTGTTVNFAGGTLNLQTNSQTVATLTVAQSTSSTNTIIGSSGSLIVNAGDLVLGSTNISVNDTVDMSGLGNFTYNAAGNSCDIGAATFATVGTSSATVSLANSNNITATNFWVGGAVGHAEPGCSSTLFLGETNIINASSCVVGYFKQSGTVDFRSGLTGTPFVKIRSTDGASATVMIVGEQNMFSQANSTNTATFDTTAGTAGSIDAFLSSLTIGNAIDRYGYITGLFKMGAGVLTVTNLTVGQANGSIVSSDTRTGIGTFELAGGTVTATTVTIGDNTASAGTGTATASGTVKLDSGTFDAITLQQGSSSGGTNTAAFIWADGTIGNISGTNLSVFGLTLSLTNAGNTSGTHTFDVEGANSASLAAGSVIAGVNCAITKIGPGNLKLSGTNTYSGNTTISAGKLALSGNGSISNTPNIILAGGAIFDVTGLTNTYALGAGQALTNVSGMGTIAGNVNLNAGSLALNFTNGTPAFTVTNGTLTFNGNVVSVNVSGSLARGTYKLISTNSGGRVVGTLPSAAIVAGVGTMTGALSIVNSELYLTVDHAPAAQTCNVTRVAGLRLLISLSNLATNWSDSDGDAVSLAGINLMSTNGVNLQTNSSYILYTNSANVSDQISYTVSDSYGFTSAGYINIAITNSVTGTNSLTGIVRGGTNTVTAYGIPGFSYILERATNLVSPSWIDISTNSAATNGLINAQDAFHDLGGIAPSSAYYRLKWSQ